jgi:NADH-quinone oxidoreductase subunit N
MSFINNLQQILKPEIFLGLAILFQILTNVHIIIKKSMFTHKDKNEFYFIQTGVILIITLFLTFKDTNYFFLENSTLFSYFNLHTTCIKSLILFFSIVALPVISQGLVLQRIESFEFYSFFLFSVLSSILMVSSSDFLSLYLIIEMQALSFYILCAFRKDSIFSVEAAIKYFIFGSIASCILLFSLSFLYGFLGTLNFQYLSIILISFPFSDVYAFDDLLIFTCVFIVILVIFFKLGVAPLHFWVPDVYEGSPVSSTLIFSFLPKLVLLDLLVRFSFIFGNVFKDFEFFFIISGLLTVFLGSLFAIYQTRLKRFLIYSSISQVGFPVTLLGLGMTSVFVQSSLYFFILVYTISSILTWSFYIVLYQYSEQKNESVNFMGMSSPVYLGNLFKLNLDLVLFFISCFVVFSLCGIPPFYGFLIKYIVFKELVINEYFITSIILIFFSVISMFFYLRIVKVIAFEKITNKNFFNFIFSHTSNNLNFFYLTSFIFCLCLCILTHVFLFFDFCLLFSEILIFTP